VLCKSAKVIADGVETGKKMAKEYEKLDQEIAKKLKALGKNPIHDNF
jgi:hypothetical protein